VNRILVLLANHGFAEFLVRTEQHGQFITCSVIGRKAPS
jgi:hypothetical protein